ncbi:MAG TPA: PQQ-dependent sugar dehydrogenase [Verrucomicrobiae bacterium]|nr:PQQ-dependent sugar dehydrogenase [Verrucomicrobiae bacterium]
MERLSLQLALAFSICAVVRAAEVPPGFVEETLATNLNAATAIAPMADGRILIADQTGTLLVWKNGRLLDRPALTLHVTDYWERGLIGVMLHPDFPRTPYLFTLYVTDRPFVHHVLSRFTFNGDSAEPASEMMLLEGDDQAKLGGRVPWGHQGGPIRFGPDGKIYIALGEQTAGMPSQRLETFQGKILRINSDGSIPADNPFFNKTTGKYRAIWAYGLRNPFGISFQPETGRLFESDVGESSWEEVNEILPGLNYGWPLAEGVSKVAEGMSTNTAFKNPLYTYPPVIGRCIVGAAFYLRSSTNQAGLFPEKWRGKYFFGDWAANWVKALDPDSPTNVLTFARGFNNPVAVEVAPDHSLLVLNRGTLWRDNKNWRPNTGSLIRISYPGPGHDLARLPELRPPLPEKLSASGLFTKLTPLTPRDGLAGLKINLPPWQPGTAAGRWISLPEGGHLSIRSDGEFEFPAGAIVVQHYTVETTGRPFETQVLWFIGPRTARGAAYRWNEDGKDADKVEDSEIISLPGDPRRRWFSPGAEENLNVDLVVSGFLLPLNVRQLRDEQLEQWNKRGWLAPRLRPYEISGAPRLVSVDDARAPLELRVRSYLDVNCAACHRPGGPSRGNFDARFATPLSEKRIINGELFAGDLGSAGARVVVPGHPEQSIIFQRLSRNDLFRMPPVSVNDESSPILPVLAEWIRSLPDTDRAVPRKISR